MSKYSVFSSTQIEEAKKNIRKRIFFLLLIVDPETKDKYDNINVEDAFNIEIKKIGGMNRLLSYPKELVEVLSLLEAALMEYENPNFEFKVYRKLVLDAGALVENIKGV